MKNQLKKSQNQKKRLKKYIRIQKKVLYIIIYKRLIMYI